MMVSIRRKKQYWTLFIVVLFSSIMLLLTVFRGYLTTSLMIIFIVVIPVVTIVFIIKMESLKKREKAEFKQVWKRFKDMKEDEAYRYRFNVVVFGIEEWPNWRERFLGDTKLDTLRTLGIVFHLEKVRVREYGIRLGLRIILSLEHPPPYSTSIYSHARGGILLCDPRKKESVEKISVWCELLREHCGDIPILIIANQGGREAAIEKEVALDGLRVIEQEIGGAYEISGVKMLSLGEVSDVRKLWYEIAELIIESLKGVL